LAEIDGSNTMDPFLGCPAVIQDSNIASISDVTITNVIEFFRTGSDITERWTGQGIDPIERVYTWGVGGASQWTGPCANGFGTCTYWPGWTMTKEFRGPREAFTTDNLGAWSYQMLYDDQVVYSVNWQYVEPILSAESTGSRIGIVNQDVTAPFTFRLATFEDAPDDPHPVAGEVVNGTITGPNESQGEAVYGLGSGSVTDSNGMDAATIHLGSKPGTYTLKLNTRWMISQPTFDFFAIDNIDDLNPEQEHPDTEQGVGLSSDQACDVAGNPVTLSIGNKFQREVDIERSGLSLVEFVRYHNSLGFVSQSFSNYWTHTYDRFVEIPLDPLTEPVKVIRPDGKKFNFTWNGSGYESSPGMYVSLEQVGGGWRFIDEEMIIENFDADGFLIDITDLQGRSQIATFDASNKLQRIEDNVGGSLDFTYDVEGRLSTVTDQAGRTWTYRYEVLGRLGFVDNPDGTTRQYHYDDLRHAYALTGITDERGIRYSTYEYDENGLAIASYHAGNVDRIDVQYEPNGDRIVVDSSGNATVYATRTENKRGILDAISGPICSQGCGLTDTQYSYDPEYNITSKTSYGVTTQYGNYDAKGQPGYIIEALGTIDERRVDYEYDPRFFNFATKITELSIYPGQFKITDRTYDSAGNLTSESFSGFDPSGQAITRTTTSAFNGPFGQVSSIDGPRTDIADIKQYEYYPNDVSEGANKGKLKTIIDANGIRVRDNIQYSDTGKVISESRPNGVTVTYQYYTGNDRIQSVTESGGGVFRKTQWEYTLVGDVSTVILGDETGQEIVTRMFYDSARRLNRTESRVTRTPVGQSYSYDVDQWEKYQFDGAGNVTTESHFSSDLPLEDIIVQRVFDAYNRIDTISMGGVIDDYDYNPDGTLAVQTDGNLNTTTYSYDDFKRLTRTEQVGQVITLQSYDVHGNLNSVVDPENAATTYSYDDLGNLIGQVSPDSGATVNSYNAAGQVIGSVDAKGQITSFTYDAAGRLTSIDRPGTDYDVTYVFNICTNGVGRLCTVSTGWGHAVQYGWNAIGDKTSVTANEGQVRYGYGPAGNLRSITYPSGRAIWFENDGGGLPVEITLLVPGLPDMIVVDNIKYSPLRRPVSWRASNGKQTDIDLDARHRPVSIDIPGVWNWSATIYDSNDNLTGLSKSGDSFTFGYDPLDRLVSFASPSDTISYVYDDVGNRISQTVNGVTDTGSYQPQANRIDAFGSKTYALDANGNTISVSINQMLDTTYSYTSHNRLIEVTDEPSSTTVGTYQYDGLGQRVSKTTPAGITKFVYGLNGELLAELDDTGKVLHEYVYLNGIPIADLYEEVTEAQPSGQTEVVVDSNGSSALIVGSNWQQKSSSAALNGTYWQNRKFPDRYVRWYVDEGGFVGGYYDVFVKWLTPVGDGTQTTYRVLRLDDQNNGVWTTETVSHAGLNVGDWALLGNFRFHDPLPSGRYQGVYLRGIDNNSGLVGTFLEADAIKLVPTTGPLDFVDFRFIHPDHLGTPHAVTDKNGQVVWSADYEPFGEAAVDEDPDSNLQPYNLNVRFPGQYFDAESGLNYNYFRDYNPEIGRYLETDPIGLTGGVNTYSYSEQNPIMLSDPNGLTIIAFLNIFCEILDFVADSERAQWAQNVIDVFEQNERLIEEAHQSRVINCYAIKECKARVACLERAADDHEKRLKENFEFLISGFRNNPFGPTDFFTCIPIPSRPRP
jgi:RHS repeat-associated protein